MVTEAVAQPAVRCWGTGIGSEPGMVRMTDLGDEFEEEPRKLARALFKICCVFLSKRDGLRRQSEAQQRRTWAGLGHF
jgi:hypothetical protein